MAVFPLPVRPPITQRSKDWHLFPFSFKIGIHQIYPRILIDLFFNYSVKAFGISDYPLLVADTVVTTGGQILRKAKSIDDARNILMTQSGNITSIITCMIYQSKKLKLIDISSTDYIFDDFNLDDLEVYLKSGDWQGKAGACMVEGFCKSYIKEVRGFESTAMGLNTQVLKRFLSSEEVFGSVL